MLSQLLIKIPSDIYTLYIDNSLFSFLLTDLLIFQHDSAIESTQFYLKNIFISDTNAFAFDEFSIASLFHEHQEYLLVICDVSVSFPFFCKQLVI